MFQVKQSSHLNRDIAKRYPTGTEPISPGAQIDQVVVSTGTVVRARMSKTDKLAFVQIGLSFQERLVEGPETGHGAELLVFWRADKLEECFHPGKDCLEEIGAEAENNLWLEKTFEPEVAGLAIFRA